MTRSVELARWQEDWAWRDELDARRVPRLLLVDPGVRPPRVSPEEDWIRLPAGERDVAARLVLHTIPGRGVVIAPREESDHTTYPVSADVPAAVALFAAWLLWGIATEQAPTRRAAGVRRRHAGRSPPGRAVRLPARS